MRMHKVDSSNIDSVGYDPEKSLLEIWFKSGGRYQYPWITPLQFAQFMAADSHGQFFAMNLRTMPFTKLPDSTPVDRA